jgi:hypothetical protein
VSIVLSLGTPPLATARLAWSVVQAAGIVGSAGRFESPAPQALPALVEPVLVLDPPPVLVELAPVLVEPAPVLVALVAPVDPFEPLDELVDPGDPVPDEALDPWVPEPPDVDARELPIPLLPGVELPEPLAESDPPTDPEPPPHALPASARTATSKEAAQVRRWRIEGAPRVARRTEGRRLSLNARPGEIDLRRVGGSRGRPLLRRAARTTDTPGARHVSCGHAR